MPAPEASNHTSTSMRTPVSTPIILVSSILAATVGWSATAFAGVPECNNVRLEDAAECEIRGDIECDAGCDELSYEQACATKLHTVCREECVLDPEPSCVDECTVPCSEQCDAGINVICQHNCFDECVGSCDASCEGAADPGQCHATCEATCDGECDIQCPQAVGASCYQHCIECCGGSCGAQANMTCQTSCQEEEFEQCTIDLNVDCSASCSGAGAIFCDGQYVVSGDNVEACAAAAGELISSAIQEEIDEAIDETLDETEDFLGGGFCACVAAPGGHDPFAPLLGFAAVLWGWRRRRA